MALEEIAELFGSVDGFKSENEHITEEDDEFLAIGLAINEYVLEGDYESATILMERLKD